MPDMPEAETMLAVSKNEESRSGRFSHDPIARRARRRLEQSPLFRGRSGLIRIHGSGDRLVLEGRLPSYYLKQMLQTVLRGVEGVKQIENRVVVDWPVAK